MQTLELPISSLSGVGKTRAKQLEKLGVFTLKDLLYHFPRAYENRGYVLPLSVASENENAGFLLTVATEPKGVMIRKGLTVTKFRAFDDSGSAEIVFFNSPYVKDVFHTGSTFRFYGKLVRAKNKLQIQNPKYEPYVDGIEMPDYVPIYPLTDGISSKMLEKLIRTAFDTCLADLEDHLPEEIRLKEHFPTLTFALKNIHFPESRESLSKAMTRLAFDEMMLFGLGIAISSKHKRTFDGYPFKPTTVSEFTDLLPYELTDSQKEAINDVYRDTVLKSNDGKISPMARILVGDVGSGKTVCAEMALYFAVKSNYQAALMVPTEILARQHYAEISVLFEKLGYKTELLVGATSQKEKNRIYKEIASGETDIVVGTHALISDKVSFSNLGIIITDEQHRFGVNQRATLKEKGKSAHMLVMSATPIPRTLALTMYGDLDISRITQMPKGRMRVDTFVVDEAYRHRLNEFIRKQVADGNQCYVVCPSIEKDTDADILVPDSLTTSSMIPNGSLNLKNAVEYAEELKAKLPEVRIATLHGKMKSCEKDEIMRLFVGGEIDVLVSTTVIEVGVNVPNATLMIVENAERFGLSQLHQLRGRVGRGNKKSYCVLVSDHKSEISKERLHVMKTTYDGFEIAEKDLILRGPGDFFSSNFGSNLRQSGGFEFKLASLCNDSSLMEKAFSYAKSIIDKDPDLKAEENSKLHELTKNLLQQNKSTIS